MSLRLREGAPVAIVMLLALLAYANSFNAALVFDNHAVVLGDPRVRAVTAENLRLIFRQEYWWPRGGQTLYRPLATLSYLFNYAVLGNRDNPLGYHIVNFMFHCANALLVYSLALQLSRGQFGERARRLALIGAAVFAVHPITTEAVTNIVGRADLLATLSVVSGLLFYIQSAKTQGKQRIARLIGLAAATTAGLLSKENAIVLPAALVLYDATFRLRRAHQNRLASLALNFWQFSKTGYWVTIPPIALWLALRADLVSRVPVATFTVLDNSLLAGDWWTSRLTALKIVGKYLWLLVWPQTLAADYSFNQIPLVHWPLETWDDWKTLLAAAAVAALLIAAVLQRRRARAFTFGVGFFFVTLAPTSNLFVMCGSTMAERFLYLPSLGFAIALATSIEAVGDRLSRKWLLSAAVASLLAAYTVRTFVRNNDWRDDLTFWLRLAQTSPNSFKTQAGLAHALEESDPTHANIDLVVDRINAALRLVPNAEQVLSQAGHVYRIKGDTLAPETSASQHWYKQSLQFLLRARDHAEQTSRRNREYMARHGGNPDAATELFRATILDELGQTYLRLKDYANAANAFLEMRRLTPTDPTAYRRLGSTYLAAGDRERAAVALWQDVLIDPNSATAVEFLRGLYAQSDIDCVLIKENGKTRINANCPPVRQHICQAHAQMAEIFAQTGRADLAKQARARAVAKYHCDSQN